MNEERGDCRMVIKKNERVKFRGGSDLEGKDFVIFFKVCRLIVLLFFLELFEIVFLELRRNLVFCEGYFFFGVNL